MRTVDLVATGVCGVLYAVVGYLTYLGIFCPVVGVVRFWPVVVIPAVFSVLFGPIAGGVGAAIGIFISDMLVHGNALLSVTVGVTSNFTCFYLIGVLSRMDMNWGRVRAVSGVGCGVLMLVTYMASRVGWLNPSVAFIFIAVCAVTYIVAVAVGQLWAEWRSYEVASVVGLAVGSAIIGVGVWAFSQFFLLPTGESQLPLYAALIWFLWTFFTEIPFLVALGPPILKACYAAFPSLTPRRTS